MPLELGRVVASFGRTVQLEDERGTLIDCDVFGRRLGIVCADRVQFERPAQQGRGVVREVLPRQSLITRTNNRGEPEPVAANATQLVVVLAHPPLPDYFLIDRYLAAAESAQLAALLVLNKADVETARTDECRAELAAWARIGYASVQVSAHSGAGLDELRAALRAHTSLLVGQSGVGKSSILNALAPQTATRTRDIVQKTGKGSHTTTRTGLFRLPGGGELLDSPGVRDFAPGPDMLRAAAQGFREILARANDCRFADCRHAEEPDCAVRAAVASGEITARRYASYGQLRALLQRLTRTRRGY